VNQKEILDAIPLAKDADVLSSAARAEFAKGNERALLPPVAAAIAEIFRRHDIDPRGKHAAIIGSGFLVGQPAALWLTQQGAGVTVLGRGTDFGTALKDMDIIVSGAGNPHFIKPSMLTSGAVLIDAATSESKGELVGDADPACAPKCALFTPVPGGVGPVAVACLFQNAVLLAATSKD
jgi:methylenetetrahydrofolate dehydrogenase (NADP+)/methenyltetrahydrofolate cyclohydrolase